MRFSVAVLTGGESRRMGRDKAMLEVSGRTLLQRVLDAAKASGALHVVTMGGPDRKIGVRHLADRQAGSGPLAGIASALAALAPDPVVVLACDLPGIDAATIRLVLDSLGSHDVAVARTDRVEPLCSAWMPERCLGEVIHALERGDRAVHAVLARLDVAEVGVGFSTLRNVNTPDDIVRFERDEAAGGPGTTA